MDLRRQRLRRAAGRAARHAIVGTPIVGGAVYSAEASAVVFGDLDGNIYALDAHSGAELWVREQVDAHPLGGNSRVLADDKVVIGFAAIEDAALQLKAAGIDSKCCSHTGFVSSLDLRTVACRTAAHTVAASCSCTA